MAHEHPHGQIAEQLWSAVADGDSNALEQVLDDDVVWRSVGHNPLSGEYRGPEAVIDYLSTVGEQTQDFVSTLAQVYVSDDGAVLLHSVSARRGDKLLAMDYLIRLTVRDGRVAGVLSVPVDQQANDDFWS